MSNSTDNQTYDCTQVSDICPVEGSVYGYYPSLPANAFFAAIFGILLLTNAALGLRYKTWSYMVALCLGCLTEVIGYVGRIMLHNNPYDNTGFIMQVCCLIIGPAFNSAAIYITLKHITIFFGQYGSLLKPKMYTYIFIAGDVLSLVLQALGGALASSAGTDLNQVSMGNSFMMAGVAWQVATLCLFASLTVVYVVRRKAATVNHPLDDPAALALRGLKFRLFAIGVMSALLAIFIRCVYRIIEMAGGWGNSIMQNEAGFIALEGALIVYASLVQTVFHPGYGFPALRKGIAPSKTEEDISI